MALISITQPTLFAATASSNEMPAYTGQVFRGYSARCSCDYSSQKDFAVPAESFEILLRTIYALLRKA